MEIQLGRELQTNEHVCHKCDNPECVNPNHLFVGSHADNMADANSKGRLGNGLTALRGSSNPKAKLCERDIPIIRAMKAEGKTFREISEKFGTSLEAIKNVVYGKAWGHVQ